MVLDRAIEASPYHGAYSFSMVDGSISEVYEENHQYTLSVIKVGKPKRTQCFPTIRDLINSQQQGIGPYLAHANWFPVDDAYVSQV